MKLLKACCVALIAWTLTGCEGSTPPKTFPVSGKVMHKGGGPVREGVVEFRSSTNPLLLTRGKIQSDGTFTLETTRDGKRYPGALAGSHEVTIIPAQERDQSNTPVTLVKPFTVEEKENHFEIVVAFPKGK